MKRNYTPITAALPAPLEDVIGLVPDDDGLLPMLVYRREGGGWYVSQTERDYLVEVIAWSPLPEIDSEYLVQEAA